MKTKTATNLLMKLLAEDPAARKALAQAIESGDGAEVDRIMLALARGAHGAAKPAPPPEDDPSDAGTEYLT
jgi:hypothetical protein